MYQRRCCCTSLHDTGTNSVPTHVLLHDTCAAVHLYYCCVRTRRAGGVERRGKNHHTGPALAWFGVLLTACYPGIFYFLFFVRYTLPRLWHSSAFVLLDVMLYCCCCTAVVLLSYTHCGFVGCCWMFFSAVCCAVQLLYYVLLLYFGCTGWLGGSVRACGHGESVGGVSFVRSIFSPPQIRPRAGIIRRTTISNTTVGART